MKKLTLISALAVSMFITAACGNKKSSETSRDTHNAKNSLDWIGSYTNDTITLFLNPQGVCRIVTADNSISGEYVWDVDGGTILVTDENGHLTMYGVYENYILSHTGSRLNKTSK